MNKQLAQRWHDALLSGAYEQGQMQLRFENKYCCLGVLADLLDTQAWEAEGDGWFGWNGQVGMLSPRIIESFGWTDDEQQTYAAFNDKLGYTFEQIATEIQGEYL